jgi:hypothetical protein
VSTTARSSLICSSAFLGWEWLSAIVAENGKGWVGDRRRRGDGEVVAVWMVVGSGYQLMWLGLNVSRKLTPSRAAGIFFLLALYSIKWRPYIGCSTTECPLISLTEPILLT